MTLIVAAKLENSIAIAADSQRSLRSVETGKIEERNYDTQKIFPLMGNIPLAATVYGLYKIATCTGPPISGSSAQSCAACMVIASICSTTWVALSMLTLDKSSSGKALAVRNRSKMSLEPLGFGFPPNKKQVSFLVALRTGSPHSPVSSLMAMLKISGWSFLEENPSN